MRAFFNALRLTAPAIFIASIAHAADAGGFLLKPVEGGGFVVERTAPAVKAPAVKAHGLATISDLATLLRDQAGAPEKIDFSNGSKIDGVYTVMVGRADGTLGKYERATEVIVFAEPQSITATGDVTSLSGAIVFALKIDNSGASAAIQRFESGDITLTRTRKSL